MIKIIDAVSNSLKTRRIGAFRSRACKTLSNKTICNSPGNLRIRARKTLSSETACNSSRNISVRARKTLRNQNGMSLVEVMVAFVVLMMVFAIFYQGVCLTNSLNRRAIANERKIETAIEHFYTDSSAEKDDSKETSAVATCDGVTAFTLHDSVCVYSTGGYDFYYWKAGGNQ